MSNFGLISKKKVANEIAKIYKEISHESDSANVTKQERLSGWEAQSALNNLCSRLNIKPAHRVSLRKRITK